MRKGIVIGLMTLVIFGALTSIKLISNHNNFLKLNAAMAETSSEQYDSQNLLVKSATLKDMEAKIEENIQKLDSWYDENISLSDDNEQRKNDLLDTEKTNEEKFEEMKSIYQDDIIAKINDKKEKLTEELGKENDLTKEEKEQVSEYKEKIQSTTAEANLKKSVNNFEELQKIEEEVGKFKEEVDQRLKEEAQQEKEDQKEEAEQKAQEEAEQEAQKDTTQQVETQVPTTNQEESSYQNTAVSSNNFDRSYASAIYGAVNSYRSSLGLPAYSYNSSMQSCVDNEVTAYASNGVPHNYVCQPISGENAGITVQNYYSPSDMVNLWKQDQPHNRPMVSTTNTSMAVSAYSSNGMLYIEACFW